jgi:hypothetical protein
MNRAWPLALVTIIAACDPGEGEAPPAEVARDLELDAPLVFELADGQVLRIHEAELADGRVGLLEVHGDAVDVVRGRVALVRTDLDGRLVVEGADGATRNAATDRNESGEYEVFDAQLDDVELWGFDRAVFHGPRGEERLVEPVILDAVGLAWTGADLRLVAATRERETPTSTRGSYAPAPRLPGAGVPVIRDTAHADPIDPATAMWLVDETDVVLAINDPCQSSSTCDAGSTCVADASTSDGTFRCLAECVGPEPQVSELPSSDTAVCLDDGGCCDPARECSNGVCVVPDTSGSGSGSGTGPSNDVDPDAAGGCDPDGDGVISACDANPNESCKADNDNDGCANSFDDNDQDACRCSARIPKPNALAILMFGLAFFRGRPRRR